MRSRVTFLLLFALVFLFGCSGSSDGVAYDELPAVVDVVAFGGSNVAGYGLGGPLTFDPEQAYPAVYAGLLAEAAGVETQLHPHHTLEVTPWVYRSLTTWNELLASDEQIRADLASAEVVIIEIGIHTILSECADFPHWTKDCLVDVAASMPDEYEELFGTVDDLVADDTIVMALNQGVPRPVGEFWRDDPDWPAMKAEAFEVWWGGLDTAAEAHEATVIDTAHTYESGIGPEYTQSDGVHFNSEGHRLVADLLLEADGIGPDA